jgi:RNA polymerase sigma-70 factor (ECF subfamily)
MPSLLARRVRQLFARESGLSEDTFTVLYQSQLDRVFNYVRYRLGPGEAEDVTADIFARAWSRRQSYDPDKGAPSTWLWAIARNLVTDRLRRRRLVQVELTDELPSDDEPSAEVSRQEEWAQVWGAMTRLPAVDQEIIALRFGAGHTNRTIATLVGLSEANVSQRLRRALHKMREDLQGVDGYDG